MLKFPFVTMPELGPLKAALRHLTILGALDITDCRQTDSLLGVKSAAETLTMDPTRVNKLGSLLSKVPLSPKFAKMLVVALKYGLAHYAIMMVACMSVAEIFSEVAGAEKTHQEEGQGAEFDPDLTTSIDRERNAKKRKRQDRQAYHDGLLLQREIRMRW